MLRGIKKAQQDNAHRLLQCLAVAVRPLCVEELAEILAFDFHASNSGGVPTLREDWREDDEEEAVLSTCSSLIAVVPSGCSRVVQFSHFSVKEYLTSPRLSRSHGDVSRFYIDLDAAHTIMAQACLGTLLRLSNHASGKKFPLVGYAAKHWVEHARIDAVATRVREGTDDLFDISKPHFAAWLRVHHLNGDWGYFSPSRLYNGPPLYYAAFYGLYDLAERLIAKHPEQVHVVDGGIVAPLPAALYHRHFRIANLLYRHGAVVDVRGDEGRTPLYCASMDGLVDIMRWLLNHGADVNASRDGGRTPLQIASVNRRLEAVQLLLDHNAYVNSQDHAGWTPLSRTIYVNHIHFSSPWDVTVDIVRRLLEHGADPNAGGHSHSPPLHQVSFIGWLQGAELLHRYGAKVDVKDQEGKTPSQIASENGYHEIAKLLSEPVDVPQV